MLKPPDKIQITEELKEYSAKVSDAFGNEPMTHLFRCPIKGLFEMDGWKKIQEILWHHRLRAIDLFNHKSSNNSVSYGGEQDFNGRAVGATFYMHGYQDAIDLIFKELPELMKAKSVSPRDIPSEQTTDPIEIEAMSEMSSHLGNYFDPEVEEAATEETKSEREE